MVRHTLLAVVLGGVLLAPSPSAAVAPGQTSGTAPGPAKNVTATTTATTATISWDPGKSATRYRVCLLPGRHASSCRFTSDKSSATTWKFKRLTPTSGADYFAKVISFRGDLKTAAELVRVDLVVPPTPDPARDLQVSTTKTTATISWAPAENAKGYRICLLGGKKSAACRHVSPDVTDTEYTFTDLERTGKVDYFARIDSFRHYVVTASELRPINLAIGRVAQLEVPSIRPTEAELDWTPAKNADKYVITMATNEAMTDNVTTLTSKAAVTERSLEGLTPGKTYYTQVRAAGAGVEGAASPIVGFRLPTLPFTTEVMTYNLCGQSYCATPTNGIKTWSKRKPLAGAIVRKADSDLIATQESHDKDTRFITELPGFGVGAYKSSKTIFFRKSGFRKVDGGWMTLDSPRRKYAVWNKFKHRATGTPFILVDAHLQPYKGRANDDLRKAQTKKLLAKVAKINPDGLPVIYAGDYNSNKSNLKYSGGYDAPYELFTQAGIPDTYDTAPRLANEIFNSANQAKNPPVTYRDHIDHIFVSPDIVTKKWKVVVSLDPEASAKKIKRYTTPFASDHNPVTARLTIPGLSGFILQL